MAGGVVEIEKNGYNFQISFKSENLQNLGLGGWLMQDQPFHDVQDSDFIPSYVASSRLFFKGGKTTHHALTILFKPFEHWKQNFMLCVARYLDPSRFF